ncbi:MAG: hypothetical protein ACREOZ_00815 [Gloeomargaritales cyanobacterium]
MFGKPGVNAQYVRHLVNTINAFGHTAQLNTMSRSGMKALMVKIAKYQHGVANHKKAATERTPFDAAHWLNENNENIVQSLGPPSTRFIKALMFSPAPSMHAGENLLDLYGVDACHLTWGNCTLLSVYGLSSMLCAFRTHSCVATKTMILGKSSWHLSNSATHTLTWHI